MFRHLSKSSGQSARCGVKNSANFHSCACALACFQVAELTRTMQLHVQDSARAKAGATTMIAAREDDIDGTVAAEASAAKKCRKTALR